MLIKMILIFFLKRFLFFGFSIRNLTFRRQLRLMQSFLGRKNPGASKRGKYLHAKYYPVRYRKEYLLYPGKPGVDEEPDQCLDSAIARITSLGRSIGRGVGTPLKEGVKQPRVQGVRDETEAIVTFTKYIQEFFLVPLPWNF